MPENDDCRLLLRVYGDSLGMPRAFEGIRYRETYAELLKAALEERAWRVDLYNRSKGNVDVGELRTMVEYDRRYFGRPREIVVIQCGIVDCAPRPISGRTRRLVGRLPEPLRQRVITFLHSNRARLLNSGFQWRVTEPDPFRLTYRELLLAASSGTGHVYSVNVAPTTPEMEEHSPGLSGSIQRYNTIIADEVRRAGASVQLIDVHSAILEEDGGLQRYVNAKDGHHITREGHLLYTRLIMAAEHAWALERIEPSPATCP